MRDSVSFGAHKTEEFIVPAEDDDSGDDANFESRIRNEVRAGQE